MKDINSDGLRDRACKTACGHGLHDREPGNEHLPCLVISGLMEAVEADRKGKSGKECRPRPEMGYGRYPALAEEERHIKDSLPDELSDAVILLPDLAGLRGTSLELADGDIDDRIEDMAEACKDGTFTGSVHSIPTLPVGYDGISGFSITVDDMIPSVSGLAGHPDMDLPWHIGQNRNMTNQDLCWTGKGIGYENNIIYNHMYCPPVMGRRSRNCIQAVFHFPSRPV